MVLKLQEKVSQYFSREIVHIKSPKVSIRRKHRNQVLFVVMNIIIVIISSGCSLKITLHVIHDTLLANPKFKAYRPSGL